MDGPPDCTKYIKAAGVDVAFVHHEILEGEAESPTKGKACYCETAERKVGTVLWTYARLLQWPLGVTSGTV